MNIKNTYAYSDKILKHANERINFDKLGEKSYSKILTAYKSFLKLEEKRLHITHKNGSSGFELCRKRADLIDIVLKNIIEHSILEKKSSKKKSIDDIHKNSITIVATGGYGRSLLNPKSDIDLLYLYPDSWKKLTSKTKKIIEDSLYLLWDVGFKVGHAVRDIKSTINEANKNLWTKSALIESRFICGNKKTYNDFSETFNTNCIKGKENEYIESRREDFKKRYHRFGKTVFLQEPNVKNSPGGLRDIHNLIWINYIQFGNIEIHKLIEKKLLTNRSYENIMRAYDFLLRVRNELHYLEEEGGGDILTLKIQGFIADSFSYPQTDKLKRIESFMRDYYTHSKNIYYAASSVLQRLEIIEKEELKIPKIIKFLTNPTGRRKIINGFLIKNGMIFPQSNNIFKKDFSRIIKIFRISQLLMLDLSPQIIRLIQKNLNLVNLKFRYLKIINDEFKSILNRKGLVGKTLRQMHRVDFLGSYIPEFGALTCLVQHEFFHSYTADEHTLKSIETFDDLANNQTECKDIYKEIFHQIDEPYVINIALLLHDSGRAKNRKHHDYESTILTSKVCRRMKIEGSQRKLLIFLVDNHLILWKWATTKDIYSPAIIKEFAKLMKNTFYLDALLVFTYADAKSTSNSSWNDWKESLILQLYKLTKRYFKDKKLIDAERDTRFARKELKEYLTKTYKTDNETNNKKIPIIENFLQYMPEEYFYFREKKSINIHFKTYLNYIEKYNKNNNVNKKIFATSWREIKHLKCIECSFLYQSGIRSLTKVSAAFALNKINILSAEIYSRFDGKILYLFHISNNDKLTKIEQRKKTKFSVDVNTFLNNKSTNIDQLFESDTYQKNYTKMSRIDDFPYKFTSDIASSELYTIIQVQAVDHIGLLYKIFKTIDYNKLFVKYAKINTENGAAIDTLYITNKDNKKITNTEKINKLLNDLKKIIINK